MCGSRAVAISSLAKRLLLILLAGGLCGAAAGCGSAAYEARLAETAKYFAYRERLNKNLTDHKLDAYGVPKFRVPVPFRPVQKGEFAIPAGGNGNADEYDWRQPDFLQHDLPGLAGAWIADMGGPFAYAFLLSNYELFLEHDDDAVRSGDAVDPMKFHEAVVDRLTAGLRLTPLMPQDVYKETYPRSVGYSEPKAYMALRWPRDGDSGGQPATEIDGHPYRVELYQTNNGVIEVAVLFLIPVGGQGGQLNDRIAMCLETLEVTGQQPARPRADGGAAPPDIPAF